MDEEETISISIEWKVLMGGIYMASNIADGFID